MDFTKKDFRSVKFFRYRTALVEDRILTLPRELLRDFEKALYDAAKVTHHNNHAVFEFTTSEEREPLYVLFSDFNAMFGRRVVEKSW